MCPNRWWAPASSSAASGPRRRRACMAPATTSTKDIRVSQAGARTRPLSSGSTVCDLDSRSPMRHRLTVHCVPRASLSQQTTGRRRRTCATATRRRITPRCWAAPARARRTFTSPASCPTSSALPLLFRSRGFVSLRRRSHVMHRRGVTSGSGTGSFYLQSGCGINQALFVCAFRRG